MMIIVEKIPAEAVDIDRREEMTYYVYTYSKVTNKTVKILATGLTEEEAENFCESWGWNYDDGERSYWLSYDCA